jgi:hypothetical protein
MVGLIDIWWWLMLLLAPSVALIALIYVVFFDKHETG